MSLKSGSTTITRYFSDSAFLASSDPSWISGLLDGAFLDRQLQDVGEKSQGFCIFENELSANFKLENCVQGKYIIFSYRRDQKDVRSKVLNLKMNAVAAERMTEMGVDFLSSKMKTEIKEELIESDPDVTIINTTIINVFIDTALKQIFFTTTSLEIIDNIVMDLSSYLGIKVFQASPVALAAKLFDTDKLDLVLDAPEFNVIDNLEINPEFEDQPDQKLGSAFLTFLMYYLYTGDGMFNHMGIMFHDEITLEGESMGSKKAVLKKGLLNNCVELVAALKVGKIISSGKLTLAEGDGDDVLQYDFTLDKTFFNLGSAKVKKDRDILRVLLSFSTVYESIDSLFEYYLKKRYVDDWSISKENILIWIKGL